MITYTNFGIAAPPTFVYTGNAIKFLSRALLFDQQEKPEIPDECNFGRHCTVKHTRKIVRSRVNLPKLKKEVIEDFIVKKKSLSLATPPVDLNRT